MRIAIPVSGADGTIAEDFSPAGLFAFYDVHDETRAVAYIGRQALAEPGCGRTPGFLKEQGVEVVMAHGISENAVNHLREAGIVAIKDAPVLSSDALIAHLVSGTLQATPPDVATQDAQAGSCGGGGCGHCCGGQGHSHPEENANQPHACSDQPAAR